MNPGFLSEKAFDCVNHSFLFRLLEQLGFGPSFIQWVYTLYTGANMRIILNGYLSSRIDLKRGVRQGDPLSPLLYMFYALKYWLLRFDPPLSFPVFSCRVPAVRIFV